MRWFILTLILSWGTAHAQVPDPDKLENLTKAEQEARAKEAALNKQRSEIQKDISKLKFDLVKTASESEKFEREAQSLQNELDRLEAQLVRNSKAIKTDRQSLMQLIAALQRTENNPPPAFATSPGDAVQAARAARLISAMSGELKSRADDLAEKLSDLETLKTKVLSKQASLSANEKILAKRRKNIAKLVKEKAALEKSVSYEQEETLREVARLATEAKTLRDLIQSFEAAVGGIEPRVKPRSPSSSTRRPQIKPLDLPKNATKFAQAKGLMRAPVTGKIIRNYGSGEKGMTVSTRSNAQVIAPYSGRVEFSGAFKNYENVVILNVGEGYFILMTGMGDTYAKSGTMVKAGEPIGLMPFKTQGSANLYIEFRKNGGTIEWTQSYDEICFTRYRNRCRCFALCVF